MTDSENPFKSGYIALLGRPNVGKSTLLNKLVGQQISIATHKAQTTRHRLLGIKTRPDAQLIYVDTPGFHLGKQHAINHYMNRAALQAIDDVDLILFLCQALKWTEEDATLLKKLANVTMPVIAIVNKADVVTDKERLLPFIKDLSAKHEFAEVLPMSALKDNMASLEQLLLDYLSEGPQFFDAEQITDKNDRFIAAERIREQLFMQLQEEIPYGTTVEIEQYIEETDLLTIRALVWVNRDTQKSIVIGKGGERLKAISRAARISLEKLLAKKIFLRVWVKVRSGWVDDEKALQQFGYLDDR